MATTVDIRLLPDHELREDYWDSVADIATCQAAIANGVTAYSGGSVAKRMETNEHFCKVIQTELERRGQAV
jgi:threonine aldolase